MSGDSSNNSGPITSKARQREKKMLAEATGATQVCGPALKYHRDFKEGVCVYVHFLWTT